MELSEISSAQEPDSLERKEVLAHGLLDIAVINRNLRYMLNAKKYFAKAKEAFEFLYKKKKLLDYHTKIIEASTALDLLIRRS